MCFLARFVHILYVSHWDRTGTSTHLSSLGWNLFYSRPVLYLYVPVGLNSFLKQIKDKFNIGILKNYTRFCEFYLHLRAWGFSVTILKSFLESWSLSFSAIFCTYCFLGCNICLGELLLIQIESLICLTTQNISATSSLVILSPFSMNNSYISSMLIELLSSVSNFMNIWSICLSAWISAGRL